MIQLLSFDSRLFCCCWCCGHNEFIYIDQIHLQVLSKFCSPFLELEIWYVPKNNLCLCPNMSLIFSLRTLAIKFICQFCKTLITIFEMDLSKYVPVVAVSMNVDGMFKEKWKNLNYLLHISSSKTAIVKDVIKKGQQRNRMWYIMYSFALLSLKKLLFNFCKVVKASLIIFYMRRFSFNSLPT